MRFKLIESEEKYDNEDNILTKAQAEFFKNSKVRDNQDKLLICYHSSNSPKIFDEFNIGDIGFHFGTQKQAETRKALLNNNIDFKVYLNIKNPYIFDRDLFQ